MGAQRVRGDPDREHGIQRVRFGQEREPQLTADFEPGCASRPSDGYPRSCSETSPAHHRIGEIDAHRTGCHAEHDEGCREGRFSRCRDDAAGFAIWLEIATGSAIVARCSCTRRIRRWPAAGCGGTPACDQFREVRSGSGSRLPSPIRRGGRRCRACRCAGAMRPRKVSDFDCNQVNSWSTPLELRHRPL